MSDIEVTVDGEVLDLTIVEGEIILVTAGVPGPAGVDGVDGVDGTAVYFVHEQGSPSAVWTITHGLGRYPAIQVVDSAGSWWLGSIVYPSLDVAVVTFNAPFSGVAYLG